MKKYLIFCLFSLSTRAAALPEMVRSGQFSCTTCHVSPGGGGMLTSYGREFSSEKLSTWYFDGEDGPLEGLVPVSDRILVGGDARWVKYKGKSGETTFDKFWRMQTDVEAGVHFGPVWVTGMMGTRPAGPSSDPKESANLLHRGYMARADLLDDHVIVRGGLFMPKYGLMLADHTAFVRSMTGLGPDSEQTQAEVIYQNDLYEISLGALVENYLYDREGKSKSGYNMGASIFVAGRNRLNAHVLNTKLMLAGSETSMMSMGLSGVVSVTKNIYGMFEWDRIRNSTKAGTFESFSEALANFLSLNFEVYKGIIPFLRYEYADTDITTLDTSTSRWGGGVTWYPRPHMQFEVRALRSIMNANQSTTNQTDAVMHYYF